MRGSTVTNPIDAASPPQQRRSLRLGNNSLRQRSRHQSTRCRKIDRRVCRLPGSQPQRDRGLLVVGIVGPQQNGRCPFACVIAGLASEITALVRGVKVLRQCDLCRCSARLRGVKPAHDVWMSASPHRSVSFSSMRRLRLKASSVVPGSIGWNSPKPAATRRCGAHALGDQILHHRDRARGRQLPVRPELRVPRTAAACRYGRRRAAPS